MTPAPKSLQNRPIDPASTFPDAESAWFWCVQTSDALHDGAQQRTGFSDNPRCCEPVDIQKVVLRLLRQELLSDAHVKTMARYGRLQLRPSDKIKVDAKLWHQAMNRMTPALRQKGIVSV